MTPSEELRALFEADQADRLREDFPDDLIQRDLARRQRVRELLAIGAAETADDLFHAAMVFQHGDRLDDWWQAHELALRAAESGHPQGRWLAAAAYDRWLMGQGRPQKYGTQYQAIAGRWGLYEVDPATTDEERALWDVPPLAEARRRAEAMAENPPKARLPATEELGRCRVGDLEVRVRRLPAGLPIPEPPRAGPAHPEDPVPWLPAGLAPRRFGTVPGATAGGDEMTVTWHRQPPLPGEGLLTFLREEDGFPTVETFEAEGKPAAWLASPTANWGVVILPTPEGDPWVVAGTLTREELARIARSLPP